MKEKNKNWPLTLLALAGIFALLPALQAKADLPELSFGGTITHTTSFSDCPCSFGTMIDVSDPAPLKIYMPWSLINSAINITNVRDYGHVDKNYEVLGESWPVPIPCMYFVPAPPPVFVKCEIDEKKGPGWLIHEIGTTDKPVQQPN